MSILGLILLLAVLGFCAWLVTQLGFIDAKFQKLIILVLFVVAILILFRAFGVDPIGELQRPVR